MIKQKTYLITPSLLNSWLYIWNCVDGVKETEKDTICLEDKIEDAQRKAKQDFINALNRIKTEPNEYMLAGIEFEEETYKGNTCFSEMVKGGCWQIVGKKKITISGINFLMYGRLDVLKGGVIYDIKRVFKYSLPKYKNSCQHRFYLDLFPRAYKFQYLIFDGNKPHYETYFRNECEPTEFVIERFINWLIANDLLKLYFEKWECKYE